jgi:1A family penicillin-binding protein
MKKVLGAMFYFCKETFWGTFYALVMIVAGVGIASFFIYKYQMPDVNILSEVTNPQTSVIYDRTGKAVLYEIHGEENRKVLLHDQIPDIVRIATIATEDKSFYSHVGVDFMSIVRAMKVNFEKKGIFQGGSTITQQLARNVFLSREKTLTRKLKEALIAFKIENNYSKDEILDLYLNEVPYGSNAYGIESAAKIYFKKTAKDLTFDEAVFLASLPKAPSYYSPYGNHTAELKKRQEKIYAKIKELKIFNEKSIEVYENINTFSKVAPFREPIVAPHFVFYVIENLEKEYGREFLETGGLKIITTLDIDLQKKAEEAVQQGVLASRSRGATNGCLVALDPRSGQILAMVGSKDYFDKSIEGQVNVTLQPRQPGSAIKPVVYATAFEKGYQPETMITDESTDFGPDGSGQDYIPRNYDGKFHGVLPMRKTLAMSLNVPAVKTLEMVGVDSAIDMAHRLGITTFNDRKRYGLSLAIGGAEVKPLDLTAAFSVFANDGIKNAPRGINEISNNKGEKKYLGKSGGEQVINPQVARKISSILSDNFARTPIFGPSSPLYVPNKPVAAKTGTTQDFKDAWTVGFTPNIAVGVWIGNNDGKVMTGGSDGVFVAAPVWRKFIDSLSAYYFGGTFAAYDLVTTKNSLALDEDGKDKEGRNNSEKKDIKNRKDKG